MIDADDFTIDVSGGGRAALAGVLRLPSPAAYEERFEPLRDALSRGGDGFTIDISRVRFMNSSGITGISRLVLLARSKDQAIVLVGSSSIAWQAKTLTLLRRLYGKLDVQLI